VSKYFFRLTVPALLVCFILFYEDTSAQVFTETYTSLLKHFQDTVISLTSSNNSIIHGIENKVIVRSNLFKGETNIQVDKKYILSRENNTLFLRAPDVDSRENIAVLIGDFKNDTVFRRVFSNERLPSPSVYFGHVNLTETKKILVSDLQTADSVYILFRHNLTGSAEWLKVKRFTIGYNYGSYYLTYDNQGSIISQKIKGILKGLKPGQEISMSILAESSGSIRKEVPLIYFRIQ
jgi:hypothetical protein